MCRGLKTILELEEDFEIVSTALNGEEAFQKCSVLKPDIVLMDIRMPLMDGVEATKLICKDYPGTKVVVLTTFDDDELIVKALKAGAVTYLLKDIPSEKLVDLIRRTYRGDVVMQPEIASKLVARATGSAAESEAKGKNEIEENGKTSFTPEALTEPLTKREKEVLKLMSSGLPNSDIAKTLFISEGTVKNHISIIYSKLGVNDRTQAVLLAINNKLV